MGLNEIYTHNSKLEKIGIIDSAESVIWTSRYFECGDFEIHAKADEKILSLCRNSTFLTHDGSEMVGLIEEYKITTDLDGIDYITISGRCATALLARRAIKKNYSSITGTNLKVSDIIFQLIKNNIVSDTNYSNRNISILQLGSVSGLTATHEGGIFKGQGLYKTVTNICKDVEYGIKTVLSKDNSGNPKLEIQLYNGVDRSANQTAVPSVIFSPKHDNLMESEYIVSWANYANGTLTLANGTDANQQEYIHQNGTGLSLFEIPVNATNVTTANAGNLYTQTVNARRQEALANHKLNVAFDGKASFSGLFKFGVDYKLGDLVTIENVKYGVSETVRITEITECLDINGYTITPVFKGVTRVNPWDQ